MQGDFQVLQTISDIMVTPNYKLGLQMNYSENLCCSSATMLNYYCMYEVMGVHVMSPS